MKIARIAFCLFCGLLFAYLFFDMLNISANETLFSVVQRIDMKAFAVAIISFGAFWQASRI